MDWGFDWCKRYDWDTSWCGRESMFCCLQPKICTSQGRSIHPNLHKQKASPQTGGRGCGQFLVLAGQGRSSRRREGGGTIQLRRGRCCHHSHRLWAALMQISLYLIDYLLIRKDTLTNDASLSNLWWFYPMPRHVRRQSFAILLRQKTTNLFLEVPQ